MKLAKTFIFGDKYYTDDYKKGFVGDYIGTTLKGEHYFENSKGEVLEIPYGIFFEPATEEQIKELY